MVLFQDFLIGGGGGVGESKKLCQIWMLWAAHKRKWAEVWTIAGCCPDFHKQNSSAELIT